MRTTPAGSLRGTRPTICSTSTTNQSRRAWMVRIQISPRPKRPPRTLNDAGLTTARKRLFSLCVGSADERSVCNRLWIQALGYKYSGLTRPGGPCAPVTPLAFALFASSKPTSAVELPAGIAAPAELRATLRVTSRLCWPPTTRRSSKRIAGARHSRRWQRQTPTRLCPSFCPSNPTCAKTPPRSHHPPTPSAAQPQTRIFVQVGWEEERLWRKGYTWAGIMGLGWLPIIGCMALWCAASGGTR